MAKTEYDSKISRAWKFFVRSEKAASARGALKSAAPSGAFSVAGGSLPVSSADSLLTNWYGRAMYLNGLRNTAFAEGQYTLSNSYKIQADVYGKCAEELRREMARANERQPEENTPSETRRGQRTD